MARWASFAVGMALVLAPLAVGYGSIAPILRDVAAGLLVCVLAVAALDWPGARLVLLATAAWLLWSGRGAGDPHAEAVEIAAGTALLALAPLALRARAVRVGRPGESDARA